jgi:hypothetical protein
MLDQGPYFALQHKLNCRGVRLNTLHTTLRIAELEGKHRVRERGQRLCKFVAMRRVRVCSFRSPDVVKT